MPSIDSTVIFSKLSLAGGFILADGLGLVVGVVLAAFIYWLHYKSPLADGKTWYFEDMTWWQLLIVIVLLAAFFGMGVLSFLF